MLNHERIKMIRIPLALAALSLAALSAHAGDFYGGASLGASHFRVNDSDYTSAGFGLRSSDNNDTGFKLYGGYQLNANIAFEGGWVDLGKAKASVTYSGVPMDLSIKGDGLFVDAIFHAPVAQNVSLFGKVGAFRGKARISASSGGISAADSDSGTDYNIGFGATYAFNPKLALRAEWERFRFNVFDGKADTDLLSVGVNFKF